MGKENRNHDIETVAIRDIEDHKLINDKKLDKDLENLREFEADDNANNFAGNPFLYHYQLKNLLKCRRQDGKTIYEIYDDPDEWTKLKEQTVLRNRGGSTAGNIFECFRINMGSVVMFKATTAKYLYKKYGATSVLDPTAGWGGRMLGAWALDIDYTGIDTNVEMIPAYDAMMKKLENSYDPSLRLFDFKKSKLNMIWESCLTVDFSEITYDFVLTSPPYINLELYEHMTPWETEQAFYEHFLLPLWNRCCDNIQKGGKVAFNISPKMYEDAVKAGLRPCDIEEDLKQQMGQKVHDMREGKKKQDKVYIWSV